MRGMHVYRGQPRPSEECAARLRCTSGSKESNIQCAWCGELQCCASALKVGGASIDCGSSRSGVGADARGAERILWLRAEHVASAEEVVAVVLQHHRKASIASFVNPYSFAQKGTSFATLAGPPPRLQSAACQRLTKNWRRGSTAWKK